MTEERSCENACPAFTSSPAGHGTLYTGVTSDLLARLIQHRSGTFRGFTSRYSVARLVWFEMADTMEAAITREKQMKKWHRDWKCRLIEEANPEWDDLAIGLGLPPLGAYESTT